MKAIHLITSIAEALVEYGPSLLANVLATSAAIALVVFSGFRISRWVARWSHVPNVCHGNAIDAILAGYLWGAFYTLFLMYLLGSLRIFIPLALWAAILLPIAPILPRIALKPLNSLFHLPALGWKAVPFLLLMVGPLLISLTNPMPSWVDVLEGNVAPVQRLITFPAFEPSSALPSALYPVNRATPLYTAFHGVTGKLFGLEAYEVIAAAMAPVLILTLLASYRLGALLLPCNRHAGWLAAFSWGLTCNYVQLQSGRATVWQMTFALIALAKAVELFRNPGSRKLLLECAFAAAATILAHPFEGMFTVLTVLLLAMAGLAVNQFRHARQYLIAVLVGVAAGGPILWTWWPTSIIAMVGSFSLLALIPFLIFVGRIQSGPSEVLPEGRDQSIPNVLVWGSLLILLSTLLLHWDFFGTERRSFLAHEFSRYPVPTGLTVALILLALKRHAVLASLFAALSILAASLPLWLLPFLKLSAATVESFRYEMPLKAMEYWLSGVLAVAGSMVLAMAWSRSGRSTSIAARISVRGLVLGLLVLPMHLILGIQEGPAHASAGLLGMWRWQLHLASEGYWRGWGDARRLASPEDRELFSWIRARVADGSLDLDDRIAHVAAGSNLQATPFPAFTGITQDLFLPEVDTMHMHTRDGRLHDVRKVRPEPGWVLVERSMLTYYPVDPARIVFQNNRVVLAHTGSRHGF